MNLIKTTTHSNTLSHLGVVTFYNRQRNNICEELKQLGLRVETTNKRSEATEAANGVNESKDAITVKTVDGFQVSLILLFR